MDGLRVVARESVSPLDPCCRCRAKGCHWDRINGQPYCPDCQEAVAQGHADPLILRTERRACALCGHIGSVRFLTFPLGSRPPVEMDLCADHFRGLLGRQLDAADFTRVRRLLDEREACRRGASSCCTRPSTTRKGKPCSQRSRWNDVLDGRVATGHNPLMSFFTREQCLQRLRAQVAAGQPIIGGGAGTGISRQVRRGRRHRPHHHLQLRPLSHGRPRQPRRHDALRRRQPDRHGHGPRGAAGRRATRRSWPASAAPTRSAS